jgi:hypothetical protein
MCEHHQIKRVIDEGYLNALFFYKKLFNSSKTPNDFIWFELEKTLGFSTSIASKEINLHLSSYIR